MMNNNKSLIDTSACEYDVAIIGFGPTGAVLANLLAQSQLKVLVLEREADVLQLPRAIRFDAECMRVFQTIGLADTLLEQVSAAPGMKFVNAQGDLLIEWQRPTEIGSHGWSSCYRVHQPELEHALRQRLTQNPLLNIKTRHDVFALAQHEDHVRIQYENMRNGELLAANARYVVGCDGARSLVRRLMGSSLSDLKLHERWLVVDLLLKRPMPELGEYSIQYCDPQRPSTYICGAGERRRWEIMVMPDDDLAKINTPEWLWQQLARWITPRDAEIERSAIYMFHSVVAHQWRNCRLLLAGDAAHQTPPFMGQGMAAGIRDAANLAWKLRDVINGSAADSLLDTYESERSPHVKEFIEGAVRFGEIIQTTDLQAVADRDTLLSSAIENFRTPEPRLGPGAHDECTQGVCAQIAPQFSLENGELIDNHVGYQHVLLVTEEAASAVSDHRCVVLQGQAIKAWLQSVGACAVLVRPDRYVFGLAHSPSEITALLDRAFTGGTRSSIEPQRQRQAANH